MTIAWMLYLLLVGALLSCAALAIEGVLQRMCRPTRWVWVGALTALVAFALAATGSRGNATPGLPESSAAITNAPAPTKAIVLAAPANRRDRISSAIVSAILAVEARVPGSVAMPLAIVWGTSSVLLLIVLVGVNRRMNRERRSWMHADVHGVSVRVAADTGPAVIGLAKPEIVVPCWLLERSQDEQRLVIVHEREHVLAHDQLLPIGAWIVAALLPWHPATWWAMSRLRLAIELDCDARVLNRGVQARPYGDLLIDIAGRCAGHRVGALALADGTSHLERRLLAMKPTRSRFTFLRTTALGAIAMSAMLVACEASLPTAADLKSMDASTAVAAAQRFNVIPVGDERLQYFVDGVQTPQAEATSIPAKRIASVSIWKSTSGAPPKVAITTVDARLAMTRNDSVPRTAAGFVQLSDNASVHFKLRGVSDTASNVAMGTPTARTASLSGVIMTRKDGQATTDFPGLIYIDGVLASASSMHELARDQITTVNVIKGSAATARYSDPAAVNGVIEITTTRGAAPANAPEVSSDSTPRTSLFVMRKTKAP